MPGLPPHTDPERAFDASALFATLPDAPGVYRFLDGQGNVLYVGKAKNLKKRVRSYFQKSGHSPRIALMLQQIAQAEITSTRSEAEALLLENTLIKTLAPKYNILFRDDKSYPALLLSGDKFPRLSYHRGAPPAGAERFGPFPGSAAVRETLLLLQKTFFLRTCENSVFAHRSRPCLLHQIHLCKAPCVGAISPEEYAQDVHLARLFLRGKSDEVTAQLATRMDAAATALHFEEAARLRDQIRAVQTILHRQFMAGGKAGNADILVVHSEGEAQCVTLAMVRNGLHLGERNYFPQANHPTFAADDSEVLRAFASAHYQNHPPPPRVLVRYLPEALDFPGLALTFKLPRSAQEKAWLAMAERNAALALQARLAQRQRSNNRLQALFTVLTAALGLPHPPQRIECFDISHTQGERPVASCVVCVDGLMKPADYRRFNIRDVTPGDDIAAMHQALVRRYEKVASGEATAPDLLLVDGGKGQLRAARQVLTELNLAHLPCLGIAKGEGRKPGLESLLPGNGAPPFSLPPEHPAFHLIQEIRDEAHRFAVAGHRSRRAKPRGHSRLEDIPGIGPARRRQLLAHFGGLEFVKNATVEDLQRLRGISPSLAEAIHCHFHALDPPN